MEFVPQIAVDGIQGLGNDELDRLGLILNFEAWKISQGRLYLVFNGAASEGCRSVRAIFPDKRVSLNYDTKQRFRCQIRNLHKVQPSYLVRFENQEKAAHMLPFFSEIEYFYIHDGLFYIHGRDLPDLAWKYEVLRYFENPIPIEYYDICVDFEAYGQKKTKTGLHIYPSELGAGVVFEGSFIDEFHSLIHFHSNWTNSAKAITGIPEMEDAPEESEVISLFWEFCAKYSPFRLLAKGKFMEQHVLKFYVHEFELPCDGDHLHSTKRKVAFDCEFHRTLTANKAFKYHCALDDALVLAKLLSGDPGVVAEIQCVHSLGALRLSVEDR